MKKILAYYLKPYYKNMIVGFFLKFTGTIMDLCLPWILAYMIDNVIPIRDKKQIYQWGIIMIICSLFAVSFNILANWMAAKVSRDTTKRIRHDLFQKIMYLSSKQTDSFTKPSLISRLTSDTYNVHQMLGRIQRLGVRAPILAIGGILITLTLDPVLTLVLISVMPFIIFITTYISKKSIPMYMKLQDVVDQFVRIIREDIAGIRVIKALSKIDYERNKYDAINQEVVAKEKKAGITMAIVNPSMNLFLNIGLILVILAGAYRVHIGQSEVGKILAFMTYFTIILNALMNISKMFVILSKSIASANRIMKIIDAPEDMKVQNIDQYEEEEKEEKKEGYLIFDHVSFSYNKAELNLHNINFMLKKGETLGIIGSTGSGKSTIVQLLMRLYDVDEGAIYIRGKNIRGIETKELRNYFGVAFQNDTIFEDSIFENIRLGRDLSMTDIQNAVHYAQAKEFIETEEKGYEEKLNIKGANLSGGQKQRLLIARALASHPDILILDDSSSALDYKTDAALRKELKEHFHDTTTIIIAQRVSSILYADHILVLEDGEIAGYGTHDELIKNCPIYQEISESQMGGIFE